MSRPRLKVTGTDYGRFSNSPITRIRGGSNAGAHRGSSFSGSHMDASGHAEIPLNAIDCHVGARLRARRLFLQMSEDWLAGRLNVTTPELADFEAGRARIAFDQLLWAADALDVAERYFYQGFGGPTLEPDGKPSWLRDVDRWFSSQVFPHERTLLGVARKMTGNVETAQDVVQQTYVELMSGDKWRGIENPRAYAMRAVRSISGRILQRARIVPFDSFANMDEVGGIDPSPNAHDVLSAKEKRRIILEAIEQLPPQCRQVVKLRRLKEMPPKQIADEMGISLSMVEKHLAKGMTIIADKLSASDPEHVYTRLAAPVEAVPGE